MNINNALIIDVREPEEFNAEHVPNSINIPLSQLAKEIPKICENLSSNKIIFLCQSGNRAKKALSIWNKNSNISACTFEGGLFQWKIESGLIVKNKLPIMQQVQLVIGIIIFTFSILTYVFSIYFLIPILLIGIGLSISGLTGFCGLAHLLRRMPWNSTIH